MRAEYLYSAMADVAALAGDKQLLATVDTTWRNMVSKKFYVTGGTGAVPGGERFGHNYELPNTSAYNETRASVADIYWNQRMFQLHGDAKHIDILEKVLYNGLLLGVGLDGKSFFYSNVMQIKSRASFPQTGPARAGATLAATHQPNVLSGITELTATVPVVKSDAATNSISTVCQTLTALPYYAWANRGNGEMTFWFPRQVTDVDLITRKPVEVTQGK